MMRVKALDFPALKGMTRRCGCERNDLPSN